MGAVRHTRHTRGRLLANFADTGRIDLACQAVGVSRDTHYDWLKKDEQYAKAFEVARLRAVDLLEAEAWRRAKDGVEEPLLHAGKRVVEKVVELVRDENGKPKLGEDGHPQTREVERPIVIVRYSDQVLMFLLKGRKREVYGDKVEATGKDGEPLFSVDAVRAYMKSVPDEDE